MEFVMRQKVMMTTDEFQEVPRGAVGEIMIPNGEEELAGQARVRFDLSDYQIPWPREILEQAAEMGFPIRSEFVSVIEKWVPKSCLIPVREEAAQC